jgi:hypothetical protein
VANRIITALLIALFTLPVFAQKSEAERIEEMERQIEILSQEIEALKNRQTEKRVIADTEQFGLGAAASKVYRAEQGLSFGGYGEYLYQNFAGTNDAGARVGTRDNADALRAILYTGYKFNDRILMNTEIEFEHGSTGAGGEVSLEFGYLDFLVGQSAGVRAGLVLIPMGFINEQHEPTAFLGANRPATERLIIPSTWREMGAGGFGESGQLSWRGYVVNGMNAARFTAGGIRSGRGNGARALAEDLAVTARLDWQPVVGTTLGLSGYAGQAGQEAAVGGETIDGGLTLFEVHAETKIRGLWLRGLYSAGTIDDAAQINRLNNLTGPASIGEEFGGWYGEAGYDLASLFSFGQQSVMPFFRYESLDTQRAVPAGYSRNPANEMTIFTLGVQYKPIPQTVIKADYQNIDNEAGTGTNQWNLLVGYIF